MSMNISEAAKQTGLTAVTLRYYEREGLIPPVTRKNGGVRNYSQEDITWIHYVKHMRQAGLSVEALADYVHLIKEGEGTEEARMNILLEERAQLEAKYEELGKTLQRLGGKIANYEERELSLIS